MANHAIPAAAARIYCDTGDLPVTSPLESYSNDVRTDTDPNHFVTTFDRGCRRHKPGRFMELRGVSNGS